MKRISIVIVLSLLVPAVSQASRYSSQRYQVRYSPYAFSYHNSGLIPGGVTYSPYAFKSGNSGLVYEGTRYTPYAFNYNNAGLVVDYYLWHTPTCSPDPACRTSGVLHIGRAAQTSGARRSHAASRQRPTPYASTSVQEGRCTNPIEGSQIIKQYLKSRGIDNVDVNRRLSIRNRTAGIAFVLRDRNLAIRYTDPETLESFAAESKTNEKVLQRYEQRWEAFARKFEANGGTVYHVNTSDSSQIVAALETCDGLLPDKARPAPATLYAKN
jgi:hypothetical protein